MYNVLLPAYYYITVVLHIHKNCTFLGSAHCFMNTCDTTAAMDRVPFPLSIALCQRGGGGDVGRILEKLAEDVD